MNENQRKAGIILSYMAEIVKIMVNLIYTPVMLRLLGQNEYGLYQLVYSVVSYLSLLSLGFSGAYLRFYSKSKAEKDFEGVDKLNGMFLLIFLSIAIICILCGSVMIRNIRSIFGNGLSDEEYVKAKILMALLVINLALTFLSSVFNCIVTAHEQFLFQKSLMLLQNLFSPFLTLPLLIMGFGSVGMVLVSTFLTVIVLISNIFFCVKKIQIKFCFSQFDFLMLKEMWFFTFFIFLNEIVDQINWSVDKFLLGRISGTTAVAIYGVGSQINTIYLQFSTSISNVFTPKVNRIVVELKDDIQLTRLFTKVGRVQFMVLTLIMTGFIFLGIPFIKMWAGDEYCSSYTVALFLIIPVTLPLIQNLGIEIQRAKNMHKARSVVYFFVAIINIFISIPLIKKMGPMGASLGTSIALILGNVFFMNWYYHKYIGLDIWHFWKQITSIFPALLFPCIIGVGIMNFASVSNWMLFIFWGMIYTFSYCVSIWNIGMNRDEKNMILRMLNKIEK